MGRLRAALFIMFGFFIPLYIDICFVKCYNIICMLIF